MPCRPTTLIVEDEELARRRLAEMVAADGRLELVGEATDGAAAIEQIDSLRPDLLFLDIDIPGPSGLEVLDAVRHEPELIFTTAFDRFAVTAFELAAIDYLLKPFSQERFRTAVERAILAMERAGEDGVPRATARARTALDSSPLRRLFVPHRNRTLPISVDSIRRFEGEDDYVAVYDGQRRYLIRSRLKDLERRLDPDDFVRVHRSHIVNLEYVAALRPYDRNRLLVEMDDGTRIIASRSRSVALRRRME
jgi:two-component system LytT family response regulator